MAVCACLTREPSFVANERIEEMAEYKYVTYETLDDGAIARIMLSREKSRNAQNRGLLVELDDAFLRAEADDTVRVVILGGAGPIFSSGHDLGSKEAIAERPGGPDEHPTFSINGGTRKGAENRMLQEWHYFFENTKRWRNLRKITDRPGARHRLRRRPHAHVGVRPHRGGRGRAVRRRRRHPARACAAWSTSRTRGSSVPARPRS